MSGHEPAEEEFSKAGSLTKDRRTEPWSVSVIEGYDSLISLVLRKEAIC